MAFTGLQPSGNFDKVGQKIQEIYDAYDQIAETSTSYTQIFSVMSGMEPMNIKKYYAVPYIAGRMYNIWWHTGLDFDNLHMISSNYFSNIDPAILFKFNYTLHR